MNFIYEMDRHGIDLELKYCERCGGLFLRPRQASLVYCGVCQARRAELCATANVLGRFAKPGRRKLKTHNLYGVKTERSARPRKLHVVARNEVRPC